MKWIYKFFADSNPQRDRYKGRAARNAGCLRQAVEPGFVWCARGVEEEGGEEEEDSSLLG